MKMKLVAGLVTFGLVLTPTAKGAPSLDSKTKAQLVYLVEEEKLARDVYVNLAGISRKFQNISKSEITHMGYVSQILKSYGINDPTIGSKPGNFKNKNLAALYKKIMASAKNYYSNAMASGVLIEETDIADLDKLLAQTKNADVILMANKLLNGSQNHLKAFRTQ